MALLVFLDEGFLEKKSEKAIIEPGCARWLGVVEMYRGVPMWR